MSLLNWKGANSAAVFDDRVVSQVEKPLALLLAILHLVQKLLNLFYSSLTLLTIYQACLSSASVFSLV
jgi:hypothetical protein